MTRFCGLAFAVSMVTLAASAATAADRRVTVKEELAFGRETGTLPASTPNVLSNGGAIHFAHDLSTSASYTTNNRITFNLEYTPRSRLFGRLRRIGRNLAFVDSTISL